MNHNRDSSPLTSPVIRRLSEYLLILDEALSDGDEIISSRCLAETYGNTPSQVRQDIFKLAYSNSLSNGYELIDLRNAISQALGLENLTQVCLIGTGKLGSAIAMHVPFRKYGMHLHSAFDIDPELIGTSIGDVPVYHADEMDRIIKEQNIAIAALCVPANRAQVVSDQVVSLGVTGILNYSRTRLRVPKHVSVHYEQIICSFMQLACRVQNPNAI